jgi:capsular polysaccharide biosynthesis protein
MFNNATHVAGFFGSGMANIVFTENSLKVLALGNYERCLEAFIPQLAKTNQEIYYMIGDAYGARGIHSNYSISINDLSEYINEINFLK